MSKTSGEYRKRLKEAKLDCNSIAKNNSARFLKVIRQLEIAGKNDTCIVCGARTYRDACVVIRPGFWATPRSFHERDCMLAKFLGEACSEIIKDEEARDKIWQAIEAPILFRRIRDATSKTLNDLKAKRK